MRTYPVRVDASIACVECSDTPSPRVLAHLELGLADASRVIVGQRRGAGSSIP